jgi:protein tyrosine/serine phosphatase
VDGDRWLPLEGALNARDLGGLPLRDGGTTRSGRLLRADTLQELSDADVAYLSRYPLQAIVDLRTPLEAQREGRGPLASQPIDYVNLPFVPDSAIVADDPRQEVVVADRQRADRVEHYLDYLRLAGGRVLQALEVLARPGNGAVLFHCAAGKDRTGVLAALALDIAGVRREAILDDFALTNERLDRVRSRLARLRTYSASVNQLSSNELRAERATMDGFLKGVDAHWGGPAAWARSMGADDALLAGLTARLTGATRATPR